MEKIILALLIGVVSLSITLGIQHVYCSYPSQVDGDNVYEMSQSQGTGEEYKEMDKDIIMSDFFVKAYVSDMIKILGPSFVSRLKYIVIDGDEYDVNVVERDESYIIKVSNGDNYLLCGENIIPYNEQQEIILAYEYDPLSKTYSVESYDTFDAFYKYVKDGSMLQFSYPMVESYFVYNKNGENLYDFLYGSLDNCMEYLDTEDNEKYDLCEQNNMSIFVSKSLEFMTGKETKGDVIEEYIEFADTYDLNVTESSLKKQTDILRNNLKMINKGYKMVSFKYTKLDTISDIYTYRRLVLDNKETYLLDAGFNTEEILIEYENGDTKSYDVVDGVLVIPVSDLKEGDNIIKISYTDITDRTKLYETNLTLYKLSKKEYAGYLDAIKGYMVQNIFVLKTNDQYDILQEASRNLLGAARTLQVNFKDKDEGFVGQVSTILANSLGLQDLIEEGEDYYKYIDLLQEKISNL